MDYLTEAFSNATVIEAQGTHVGLISCENCGAVILIDPRDKTDYRKLHFDWHKAYGTGKPKNA